MIVINKKDGQVNIAIWYLVTFITTNYYQTQYQDLNY